MTTTKENQLNIKSKKLENKKENIKPNPMQRSTTKENNNKTSITHGDWVV